MIGISSFRRWVVALGVAGTITGAALALSERPAQAQEQPGEGEGGCECTISGSGSFTCADPTHCAAGNYKCTITCT